MRDDHLTLERNPYYWRAAEGLPYYDEIEFRPIVEDSARLAALEAGDVDTIAVGTYDELPHVAPRFDGDLLVMTPWRPFGAALETDPDLDRRLVHTIGRTTDLTGLLERTPAARFVLERMTSMQRHGFSARELWAAARVLHDQHPGARLGRPVLKVAAHA